MFSLQTYKIFAQKKKHKQAFITTAPICHEFFADSGRFSDV
jgi:hypothetical protein